MNQKDSHNFNKLDHAGLDNRVFGIGFHKTGTSSLAGALYILGYNITGYISDQEAKTEAEVIQVMMDDMKEFNAAQDTPWFFFYQMLDAEFPGSKFILTLRDEDRWINSVVEHFGSQSIRMHELIYGNGVALGNEDTYRKKYRGHNQEVQEYFKDRPDDLLILDMDSDTDKWEQVTSFLRFDVPKLKYPHSNQKRSREKHVIAKAGWAIYWKAPLIRRLILGENHNSEPWIVRPNMYSYFTDARIAWSKLEDLFQAGGDNPQMLSKFVDAAERNRSLIQTMRRNHKINFEMLDLEYDRSLSFQAVRRFWDDCAVELRFFISELSNEDFIAFHPELNQRSYQVLQSIYQDRFFEEWVA